MSATMEELLMSAEYILAGGNYNVVLCERGIRTFETYTRNTFDIAAIPVIKKLSHLPMLADPSHGTGRRDKVPPMARAAVAAGADGLLIEVHNDPDHALSDGAQSLEPATFHAVDGRACGSSLQRLAAASPDHAGRAPHLARNYSRTGLIGGSFALALRKYTTETHISGWDRPMSFTKREVAARLMNLFAVNLHLRCKTPI